MKSFKLLLLSTLTVACALPSWAGEPIDERMSADGLSLINIENLKGKVTIIGSDTDEVTIKGKLGESADRFVFEKSGNTLLAKVIEDKGYDYRNNDGGTVFTVKMPASLTMNFEGVSSDVNVKDLTGNVDVKTVSGDIEAKNLTESIDLSTVSGDIDSRNLSGKIRLSAVSGEIDDRNSSGRLRLKAVSGNLRSTSSAKEINLAAVSGDMDFTFGEVEELVISSVSGDVDGSLSLMNNGEVKMSGVSSDIALEFQEDINAEFRLTASAGGDLVNRITNDKVQRAKYGPSSKLNFSAGNGSAYVRGNVVSGEIKVSHR